MEWKYIVCVPHLINRVNHLLCHIDLIHYEWTSSFTSWFNSVICLWILCVISWLTRLCVIFISLYVFFMHNSVWMTFRIGTFFVVHNSVLMNIHIITGFYHARLCTNSYWIPNFFPMRFCKTEIFHVSLLFLLG